MIKTGTVFVGKSDMSASADLPSNNPADPPSPELIKKEEAQQSAAVSQLKNMSQDENPVLMSMSTLFPFELFPTVVTIEKTKVNVKQTIFFGSNDIRSILISDIASVESESNMLLGTLRITQRMPPEAPMLIRNLKKDDANKARRIIQGLMVTTIQNKVDVSRVSTSELVDKVEVLGDSKA